MRIAEYLSHGQENAVSLRDLANVTGENSRSIRRQIEAAAVEQSADLE